MTRPGRRLGALAALLAVAALNPLPAQGQRPRDQVHVSVTLGGYILVGVGYTRWVEEHHALEFTLFPFAKPGEGFPFGVRAGYAWIPSDEVWRAKLGGSFTAVIRPWEAGPDRFLPILALTPGIQYDPDSDRTLRGDLWMSYYVRQKTFAPTAIEILSAWRE